MFENTKIQNFVKICPVDIELSHLDGQIYRMKLIVAFRDFANASKNATFCKQNIFMCFV
jgi:hypothetical protein